VTTPTSDPPDRPDASEDARAAVRAVVVGYVEAFASGDPDRIAAFVADDFRNRHAAALGQPCDGRVAYRERLPSFLALFAGLRYEIVDTVVEGDRACVAYRLRAGVAGEGGSGPHDIDVPGVMRFLVRAGRIVERTDYWDGLTFLRQTGAA
jgi:ketosteroid isomerase-like protein